MLILDKYNDVITNYDTKTSDMEYILNHIWQLKHIFHNEIIEVKDHTQKTIAFSTPYAELFKHNDSTLDMQYNISNNTKLSQQINKYEQQVIQNKSSVDFIYRIKEGATKISYLVRVRALVNPITGNCCGIWSMYNKLDIIAHSKIILELMKNNNKNNQIILTDELTDHQKQIIFCALLGFKQRKEIAILLEQINEKEFTERQVKHFLSSLYKKFDCSSLNELITMVVADYKNQLNFTSIGISESIDII